MVVTSGRRRARPRIDAPTLVGAASVLVLAAHHLGRPLQLAAFVAITVISVEACRVDLATRRIPNRNVLQVAGATLAAAALGWVTGTSPASLAAGAALAGGPVLVFHLLSPDGMGFGDVKWATALGGAVGLVSGTAGLLVPLLGSVIGVVTAGLTRQRRIAFAPSLAVGALVAVTAGARWMGGAT